MQYFKTKIDSDF